MERIFSLFLLLRPTYVASSCLSELCLNGGECAVAAGDREASDALKCICPQGFGGSRCEIVRPCDKKPCLNGGECWPVGSGENSTFECYCPSGWTGRRCEKDRNECQIYPDYCANGGTCVNLNGSAVCVCPIGFAGKACEQRFDRCLIDGVCKNGGRCIDEICICLDGFTGSQCERAVPVMDDYRKAGCREHPEFCAWRFADDVCNEECNEQGCFFDGFDCLAWRNRQCRIKEHCALAYADGKCDEPCKGAECGFDGGDCGDNQDVKEVEPEKAIAVVVIGSPSDVLPNLRRILAELGQMLHTSVRLSRDSNGSSRVFLWSFNEGRREQIAVRPNISDNSLDYSESKADGILLFFEINTFSCSQRGSMSFGHIWQPCFANVSSAVAYLLATLTSSGSFGIRKIANFSVQKLYAEEDVDEKAFGMPRTVVVVTVVFVTAVPLFMLCVLIGFHEIRKRRARRQRLWAHTWSVPRSGSVPVENTPSVWRSLKGKELLKYAEEADISLLDGSDGPSKSVRPSAVFISESCAVTPSLEDRSMAIMKPIPFNLTAEETLSSAECSFAASQLTLHDDLKDDEDNEQILLRAIRLDSVELVKLLLLRGEDVNCKDKDGNSALHHAITVSSVPIVNALLATGNCNVRAVNDLGQTALTLAVRLPYVSTDCARCILEYMCEEHWKKREGDATTLSALNFQRKFAAIANPSAFRHGKKSSSLRRCMIPPYSCDILSEANDPTLVDVCGRSALHYAALNNRVELLALLYAYGLKLDRQDEKGETALHLAAREGHAEVVSVLLSLGAKKDVIDQLGRTALDTAKEKGRNSIMEILEKGASSCLKHQNVCNLKKRRARHKHTAVPRKAAEKGEFSQSLVSMPIGNQQNFSAAAQASSVNLYSTEGTNLASVTERSLDGISTSNSETLTPSNSGSSEEKAYDVASSRSPSSEGSSDLSSPYGLGKCIFGRLGTSDESQDERKFNKGIENCDDFISERLFEDLENLSRDLEDDLHFVKID